MSAEVSSSTHARAINKEILSARALCYTNFSGRYAKHNRKRADRIRKLAETRALVQMAKPEKWNAAADAVLLGSARFESAFECSSSERAGRRQRKRATSRATVDWSLSRRKPVLAEGVWGEVELHLDLD